MTYTKMFGRVRQEILGQTARIVTGYTERAAIPMAERFGGILVKVVEAIDQGDGTFRALYYTLEDGDLTNAGWKLAPEFVQNWAVFTRPPIYDNGVLYVPGFYVLGYENAYGYGTYYEPSNGAAYVASPGSTSTDVCRHIFNKATYGDDSFEDCLTEVVNSALPLRDTHDQVVLAVTRNGRVVDARDTGVVGDVPGGAVPNLFRYGLQPDQAPFIFPGAVAADIPDTDLIAAGFTRGIKGAPNSTVAYGDYSPDPLKVGEWIVCRFRLYAETAGAFGLPQIYIYTSETAVNVIVPLTFRQINSKVREYYYAGKLTAGGIGKWAVGSNGGATASRIWVAGVQWWHGPEPAHWISTSDFPAPIDAAPLMANEVWLTTDRPLPLFVGNGMANRNTAAIVEAAIVPTLDPDSNNVPKDAVPQAGQPYFDTGRADGALWLDPLELSGKSLALTIRAEQAAHAIISRVLTAKVRSVPLSSPVNIKILSFSDSHGATYFPRYLKTLLAAWNINVTFVGTLDNVIGDKAGETRQYYEGRGGWGIANFFGTYQLIGGTGSDPVWDNVLGPGSVSAYTGGSFNTRQRCNPFLNNGTSGSSAPVVPGSLPLLGGGTASGFRFDLVNYRDRFSLPTDIDFVLWSMGGNDEGQVGGAAALALMQSLYPVAITEMRRAWPNAQIIGWSGSTAMVNDGEVRWQARRPIYAAQLATIRAKVAAGDTKLSYVSAWMHHTVRSGFPLNDGVTDSATQAARTTLSDEIHPAWPARQQSLEPLCACIANKIGG